MRSCCRSMWDAAARPAEGRKPSPVEPALIAAVGIAVCCGLATVLQSVGARHTEGSHGLDPGLTVRLLGPVPCLAGLALDGGGSCSQSSPCRPCRCSSSRRSPPAPWR